MTEPIWSVTKDPLIYTEVGNIPIKYLERQAWVEGKQNVKIQNGKFKITGDLIFVEQYLLGDRVVKRSVHIYKGDGLEVGALLAKL